MNGSRTATVSELAAVLKITNRAVNKRAKKEAWPGEVLNKRGDQRFDLARLPVSADDVRLAFAAHELANAAPKSQTLSLYNRCAPVPVGSPDLADFQNQVALARADLLRVYLQEKGMAKQRGKSVLSAADDILQVYNTGHLLPTTFQALGSVARPTIEAWAKAWRDSGHDYTALAPRWGNRKGQRKVTSQEFNVLLSFALHPNRLRISEAVRLTKVALRRRAAPSPSSPDTLRRVLLDWRKEHYDQWVFAREGAKALNDRCLPFLERDAGLLEVGQVLVADGHKLNFQILHPFTGKPCRMNMLLWYDWASRWPCGFEIMPSENVQAVASSMRNAILNLGKIPQVAYLDNGKAFKAHIFTDTDIDFEEAGFYGMFARLGTETIFAWPYNAQSKPVERFFGTFSELERLMPTFSGTCIQDKPAHMLRNEELHRAVHLKKYGGWVPTIGEARTIIEGWFAEYGQRPHDGLKGLCPSDVFASGKGPGVDAEALRHLMMSMEVHTITRNGIPFMARNYYAPELYGRRDRVMIKYDLSDLSHVLVFDHTGRKLICRADARQVVHPIAAIAGTADDLTAVKEQIRQKRALKKATETAARAYVLQAPALVQVPQVEAHPGKRVNGGSHKVQALPQGEAEHIEAQAARMRLVDLKPKDDEPIYTSEADRYEAYLQRECTAQDLATDEMAFMRYFEKTELFKKFANRFSFLREQWLVPEEGECSHT